MRKSLKFLTLLLSIVMSVSGLTSARAVNSPEQLSVTKESEQRDQSENKSRKKEKSKTPKKRFREDKNKDSEETIHEEHFKKKPKSNRRLHQPKLPYSEQPTLRFSQWPTPNPILSPPSKKSRPSNPSSGQSKPQPTPCPLEAEKPSETYMPESQFEDISELLPGAVFVTEEQSERFLQLNQPWELKTPTENSIEELHPILPEQSAVKENPEAYIPELQFGDTPKLFPNESYPTEQTFGQLAQLHQPLESQTAAENSIEKSQSEHLVTTEHVETDEPAKTKKPAESEKPSETYMTESQFEDIPELLPGAVFVTEEQSERFLQLNQPWELKTPAENSTEELQSEHLVISEHSEIEEHTESEEHPTTCTQKSQPIACSPVKKISEIIWPLCNPEKLLYMGFMFKFTMPRSTFTSEEIESARAQYQEILRYNRENYLTDLPNIMRQLNLKTDDSDNLDTINALILCIQLLDLRKNNIKILNRSDLIYLLAVSKFNKNRFEAQFKYPQRAPKFFDVNKVYIYYSKGKMTISCYLDEEKIYYSILGNYIKTR